MPKTRRHKKDDAASQDEDLTHRVVELVTADMATRMDSFEARMEATMASLLVGLHPSPPLATRPDTPKVETTAPTVQGVSEHSHLRLSSAYPPPEKLTDALTYGQFIDWRGQMENYLTFTGLSTCPPQQQISFMLSRLTQEVNDTVRIVLALDPFQSSVAELLAKLAGHYRKKDNCRIRRSTFMKRQQADREPFSVFYREKLKLYHLTDPCTHCHDRTIGDFLIEGLFDSEIRRKCRALDESASIAEIRKLCEAEEAARDEEAAQPARVQQLKRSPHKECKPAAPANSPKSSPAARQSCTHCGATSHASSDCWAKDKSCHNCGQRGHIRPRCPQPVRDVRDVTTAASAVQSTHVVESLQLTTSQVHAALGSRSRCQQVDLALTIKGRKTFTASGIPDTGAEVSVAGKQLLSQNNIPISILRPTTDLVSATNGSAITVLGILVCEAHIANYRSKMRIYICEDVDDFLIPTSNLIELGMLPVTFPAPLSTIRRTVATAVPPKPAAIVVPATADADATTQQLKQQLMSEFHDVFSDDEHLAPMAGPPMHIYLRDDAIPYAITTPRRIPFAWRDEVKSTLDAMVSKGIIQPADDTPTDFVSPMVVVQKPNGKLRVCTDFTRLNEHVRRPVHPFKSPWDAVSNVPRSARFFTTMDATSGYWQVPLDEASYHLTTFLTPWGRYQYRRAVMGLVSTGDEYCRRGDEALMDLGNIEKVVDDVLLHDDTFVSHVEHVRKVLARCREKGITLNPDKFHFAQSQVDYVGYIIGSNGISAAIKKIDAICKFPAPTNITELRSFMGMVNQLGHFSPDVAHCSGPLRELLRVSNAYLWTQDHQTAFDNVKTAIAAPPVLAQFDVTLPTELHTDASPYKLYMSMRTSNNFPFGRANQ